MASYQDGVAWDCGFPRFPSNLGEIADGRSTSQGITYLALISDSYAPFPAPFHASARVADIIIYIADPYPRLEFEMGPPGDCPRFHGNRGKSIRRNPARAIILITANNPPNLGQYPAHAGMAEMERNRGIVSRD